jgi:hypothetical protein
LRLRLAAAALLVAALACSREPKGPVPQGYLFEKGPYQAIYGRDGRILRLLYDQNGDGKADVVTLYGPDGKPSQVESDTDLDGVVDRWEYYKPGGIVEKIGKSRRKPGVPDVWEYPDAAGAIVRRDLDEDGDGKVDRIEHFARGRLVRVELDTDRDGKMDRWQDWSSGSLAREDLDLDGDGWPDRSLRYNDKGDVVALDLPPLPASVTKGASRK